MRLVSGVETGSPAPYGNAFSATALDGLGCAVTRMLQAALDQTQAVVDGTVRVRLHKRNVIVAGRRSGRDSLFDDALATFGEDAGAYD